MSDFKLLIDGMLVEGARPTSDLTVFSRKYFHLQAMVLS
jgi:hypothetical protein